MHMLGSLVDVKIREAWANESSDFTPWLAEHLDELSKAVSIPLELEGKEVQVSTFYADILARNREDGTRVLIENQLEQTDHGHLGQILTYLAGLDAHTVIWIATEFREAHLSALKWLNEHTEHPFAFFAVKVRVVRIGDSPLAPIFEVIERPNEWERQIHETTQSQPSDLTQQKLAFWSYYIDRHPDEAKFGKPSMANSRWHQFKQYGVAISFYAARTGVGLFIRGTFGAQHDDVAELLSPHREQLAQATGSIEWHEDRGHYFNQFRAGDIFDKEQWPQMADWLHGMILKYEQAIRATFGAGRS